MPSPPWSMTTSGAPCVKRCRPTRARAPGDQNAARQAMEKLGHAARHRGQHVLAKSSRHRGRSSAVAENVSPWFGGLAPKKGGKEYVPFYLTNKIGISPG